MISVVRLMIGLFSILICQIARPVCKEFSDAESVSAFHQFDGLFARIVVTGIFFLTSTASVP